MKLLKSTVVFLVLSLAVLIGTPARAQLADPLSLAALGVLLPFFSDPAAGYVSIFEIASPVEPTTTEPASPFDSSNLIQAIFFNATCDRDSSTADLFTSKQAKAWISSAPGLALTFNGLAALASSVTGNDLGPTNLPFHSRVHWIDAKSGRLRELEPITVATFLGLSSPPPFMGDPGPVGSIAWPSPLVWNPLRSAASFVTPQDSASVRGSLYLICPSDSIQSPTGDGVFPSPPFPPLVNRDGSLGFARASSFPGVLPVTVAARIYDGNEALVADARIPCQCLTVWPLHEVAALYGAAPTLVDVNTTPVWYTELLSTAQSQDPLGISPPTYHSFTGYWGLEVAGSAATLFHRLSNASLDNLSPTGHPNPFGNR